MHRGQHRGTRRVETLIVGAGHAGLALSYHLTRAGRDHVVLERGRIGERWHAERWDSLRLLTPNWLNALPGQATPTDRDGFATRAGFAVSLGAYAASFGAPVVGDTTVERVARRPGGRFRVQTTRGTWTAANVVVASGDCDLPRIPWLARDVPAGVLQMPVSRYRRPELLPDGGVLVVGAGPSGQQVARELCSAGRDVVVAAGRHARAPRRYRGRDIWHWLDAIGSLETRIEELPHRDAARRAPSIPLTGACGGIDIDLGLLHREGVTVTGRLVGFDGGRARFADDLVAATAEADQRMRRTLAEIDAFVSRTGAAALPPTPVAPVEVPSTPLSVDLAARGIGTIVWATGYRRSYHWLDVPEAVRPDGEIDQREGVTPVPGLYTLGIRFQRRHSSHFIGGAGEDAAHLAAAIVARAQERSTAWTRTLSRSASTLHVRPKARTPSRFVPTSHDAGGSPGRATSSPLPVSG